MSPAAARIQAKRHMDRCEQTQEFATAKYEEAVKAFCRLVASPSVPVGAVEEARITAVYACEAMLDSVQAHRTATNLWQALLPKPSSPVRRRTLPKKPPTTDA